MKARDPAFGLAEATARLAYSATDGTLRWTTKVRSSRAKVGSVAGSVVALGYRYVRVLGASVAAHRLVWLLNFGRWPAGEIDHINGNRDDNRIENLREVSRSVNMQNRFTPTSDNGLLGASKWRDKYKARVTVGGRRIPIGIYDTPEEASAAYKKAKLDYGLVP